MQESFSYRIRIRIDEITVKRSRIIGSFETEMNGNGSHPNHEKLLRTTGIRNRLLRGKGEFFSSLKRRGGVPFWCGAGHRWNGIGTSRNYWNCAIFIRNPQFQ